MLNLPPHKVEASRNSQLTIPTRNCRNQYELLADSHRDHKLQADSTYPSSSRKAVGTPSWSHHSRQPLTCSPVQISAKTESKN